jgi:hypothetical protein
VTYYEEYLISEPFDGPEEIVTSDFYAGVLLLDLILGSCIAAVYFSLFVISLGLQQNIFSPDGGFISILWTTSDQIGSTRLKHAATRKINLVLNNARRMHGVIEEEEEEEEKDDKEDDATTTEEDVGISKMLFDSQADPTFQNFLVHGEGLESKGSMFWTWKRLVSFELVDHDGIWIPARTWIFQFGQVVIALFVAFALFNFVAVTIVRADEANAALDPNLPQWVHDIVPTGKEVNYALTPAAIIACCVMGFLIVIYLPRYVGSYHKSFDVGVMSWMLL